LEASSKKELERQRLYQQEVDILTKSYMKAFQLLEKKEAALEWSRRRVQLDSLRRNWFETFKWEECPPVFTNTCETEDQEILIIVSETEQLSLPKEEQLEEIDEDENLSFHSAVDQDLNEDQDLFEAESDIAKILDQSEALPLAAKSDINSDVASFDIEEKSIAQIEIGEDSWPSVTQIDIGNNGLPPYGDKQKVEEKSHHRFYSKGENDINWLLYPGTEKECFGQPNDIEISVKHIDIAFEEILSISKQIVALDEQLVPFKLTLRDSVLNLWNRQVQMISYASLSSFFSYMGPKVCNDIRFHFQSLNSYFLFGSPDFCMLIRDRLFKDRGDFGLNLNGCSSDTAVGKIDKFVADIIPKVQQRDINRIDSQCFISLDLSGIKIGMCYPFINFDMPRSWNLQKLSIKISPSCPVQYHS
jgi:hypothetical protein